MRRQVPWSAAGAAGAAAMAVAVALTSVVAFSADGDERAERPVATGPTTSTSTAPALSTPCRIGGPTGDRFLGTDQAKLLSTAAATAVRKKSPRARLAARVAVTLDASPADAAHLARTLLGAGPAQRLSCRVFRDKVDPETMGRSGLTPRADRLRRAWSRQFGPLPAGGFATGGVSSGHVDDSSHYDGRAVDVFFRPVGDAAQARRGWVFAQWVAAHADDFDVLSVIYADHIWTSWASTSGWRDYTHPSGSSTNAVLRHLDHVHVAVESGRPYRSR